MAKYRDKLNLIHFHCRACGHRFESPPEAVYDDSSYPEHPWRYTAICPECQEDADQAAWERALLKAWTKATGPRTPEGLKATAANLEGHPTPEEALRTRFNGMKHGLSARTADYFPAKPGRYPACTTCEHLETKSCLEGPRACLKRTELFLKHQIAFDTGDPQMLMGIRADTQAAVQSLINDMILAIAQDGGPRIRELQWYHNEKGCHVAYWIDPNGNPHNIEEIKAHPLLRHLMEYINKNSMTLADLEMTPKSRDEHELLEGYLDQKENERESMLEYQQRQTQSLESLQALIDRSQRRLSSDPVLIEHGEVQEETSG